MAKELFLFTKELLLNVNFYRFILAISIIWYLFTREGIKDPGVWIGVLTLIVNGFNGNSSTMITNVGSDTSGGSDE